MLRERISEILRWDVRFQSTPTLKCPDEAYIRGVVAVMATNVFTLKSNLQIIGHR